MPQRSAVYDMNGEFYSRLSGENRVVVPFDKISNDFVNALITREDRKFYYHHGVDPLGIARAVVRNLLFGGLREGASTITQQLARNSYPLGGKNMNRKLLEAALAFRIETELTKEQILADYMNRIYFGSGLWGVETASRAYFDKPASRMDLSEAAMLAGIIRGPNKYSPFTNYDGAVKQRDQVLHSMRSTGMITDAQLAAALAEHVTVAPKTQISPQENWAMDTILSELDLCLRRDQWDDGGIRIYTTIDPDLQRRAEAAVASRLEQIERKPGFPHAAKGSAHAAPDEKGTPYLQGACIAIDNRDGGIRALAGGRDYDASKFNRALLGRRQIGSTVKPFVYACAITAGLDPGQRLSDAPLTAADIPARYGVYRPANSDGKYLGDLPAKEGLIHSRNTMSIRAGMIAGVDPVAETLIRAGFSRDIPRFPSMFLGAFEASLVEITSAYTAFATGGVKLQPYLIDRVVDGDGHVLFKATKGRIRLYDPPVANRVSSILEEVIDRGTAANARSLGLHGSAAGKTGTTNDYTDAWFVGFNRSLTCGVWVGFDHPQTIMRGAYGSDLALPIWVDIMEAAPDKTYPRGPL